MDPSMKRHLLIPIVLLLAFTQNRAVDALGSKPQPRYVIFLMADGMGVDELELAREYSKTVLGRDLFMIQTLARQAVCTLMDTYSSSNMVTDSAAAASSWAIGRKVKNGQISIHPSTLEPIQTILEYYKEKHGFRTGIVTNDAVTGASPSAFGAHVKNRGESAEIARQFCDQSRPDVLLGGGRKPFLAGQRGDRRDLIGDFVTLHGYQYVETADELERVRSGKVLGLFHEGVMTWQVDRPPDGAKEPSTSEMTDAALRVLSAGRSNGFFLFVEECVPDKAGHKNDAVATLLGVLEFDRVVARAYQFYRKHPGETLVLVTADHECGGLQWLYGVDWLREARNARRHQDEPDPLARLGTIRASISRAVAGLDKQLTEEQRARLRWRYRQFDFDPDVEQAMDDGRQTLGELGRSWDRVLAYEVARNTGAFYTGGSHSLAPVPFFALGVGAERFEGHLNNCEVGRILFRLAGRQDFRSGY
jgi:alkaline phosphatase